VASVEPLPRRPRPPSRWTSVIGAALHARVARRIRLLSDARYWHHNTARLQILQLRRLLKTAAATEFGRTHDFARLAALPDAQLVPAYRQAVPVADYLAYRALITRMRDGGEPDLLWPGLVRDFAQTSGTTAGDKYIPVSRAMLRSNFRASLDIFSHASRFGVSLRRLLGGRVLFIGGSTDLATNEHGIRTGDLSGLVTPLIRWPLTQIYSPGATIALMSHWPSKIDAMARLVIDQDIRMVSGMPSWGIVLLQRILDMAKEQGRPERTIRELWPNFELLVHGGVKYAPFDPRVRQLYSGDPTGPDVPTRLELYPASEGFIAIQDTRGDPGLRLLSDIGNFYEFVPLEDIDKPDPPAFTADAVEKGQRYVVVMSTCAGLWRYIIGDVVEFDCVPARLDGTGGDGPSRLRIVGRHRHFMNAFGENLIVENIENAVAAAAKETGLVVGEFTAAPLYPREGRPGAVELAVELEAQPDRLERFAAAFDESLKNQCVDYGIKRTDGLSMGAPAVTPLPTGTFHRWLQARGKLGGQHKCPRCANTRDVIETILAVSREHR
jgi:hypothetical protein